MWQMWHRERSASTGTLCFLWLLTLSLRAVGNDSFCSWSMQLEVRKEHFAYCIQSSEGIFRSPNLLKELLLDEYVHIIQLTFKTPQKGILFVPDSTYAEGRNMLLLEACREELVLGFRFGYLVFVDDDVSILQGSFKAWHAEMLQWEPAIMIPAFNFVLDERRYKGRPVGVWCYDSFFVAYHRELADALLPLDASLDDVDACWWDSSFYIQYLSQIHLQGHILVSDKLVVRGLIKGTYPRHGCYGHGARMWELVKSRHENFGASLKHVAGVGSWYLEWGAARKRQGKGYDLRPDPANWSLRVWPTLAIKRKSLNS
ncbi:unnamed protein product [Symbiodinium necroappetens]|uniref:Rhodanese domain-containing protein n=1 Tax=Symbiodinium necroappetens TaxID=1628268 RepID=A0A812XG74_9DINO|nr:unnamed protein product [Symbiodinium necroappetens]